MVDTNFWSRTLADENSPLSRLLSRYYPSDDTNWYTRTFGSEGQNWYTRNISPYLVQAPDLLLAFANDNTLDPRITFSRNSLATMFDNTGRLTYAPNNLVTRSENIPHAEWFKAAISASGDLLTPTTAVASHNIRQNNALPARTNSFFVIEVKPEGYTQVGLREASATGASAAFTLSGAGTVNGTHNLGDAVVSNATITALADGWYRISCKIAGSGAAHGYGFYILNGTWVSGDVEAITFAGDGTSGVRVRKAQFEAVTYETTPRAYNATTASAYYGPRFDHDPAALTVASDTELVTNGDFSNGTTGWSSAGGANAIVGGELVATSSGSSNGLIQTIATVVGRTYRVSVSALADSANTILRSARISINDDAGGVAFVATNGVRETLTIDHVATTTSTSIKVQCASNSQWGAEGDFAHFDNVSVRALDAEPLGLLVEEARTNQAINSRIWTGSALETGWSGNASTFASSSHLAPDGSVAVQVTTTGNLGLNLSQLVGGLTVGTVYTASMWLRGTAGQQIYFLASDSAAGQNLVTFTGGWQRVEKTFTATATEHYLGCERFNRSGGAHLPDVVFSAWGGQYEAGAFATSYIPTTSATVTRAADSASMTGTNFSDWYNQTEGTFVTEFSVTAHSGSFHSITTVRQDASNRGGIQAYGGGTASRVYNYVAGSVDADLALGATPAGVMQKVAYAYKANDYAASLNGGAVVVDNTVAIIPAPTSLQLGAETAGSTEILNGHIKSLSYYATRKSDADLQALTA